MTGLSVIFIVVLIACLEAYAELPAMMIGRGILHKQTRYRFYRPGAIALANTIADLPFSAARVLLFNIVVYFMTGLHRSAGAFFTFHLLIYMAYLTIQGIFRTLGLICLNGDSALRLATFIAQVCPLYMGYMIPVFDMKRWLFWIVSVYLMSCWSCNNANLVLFLIVLH